GTGALRFPLPAVQLQGRSRLRGQGPLGDALPVRGSPREGRGQVVMAPNRSDALVFFGATGDLAYKKIFPALQAMVKRGHLDLPAIGVAKAGWTVEQFRGRVRDSLERHGGIDPPAFDHLVRQLRYVDGDYADAATFRALRDQLGGATSPSHYLAIPP